MRQFIFALIVSTQMFVGLTITSYSQSQSSSPQPIIQNPEVATAIAVLDTWITATVDDREQPGLSIGIVYGQDLIWAKGYGFADMAKKIPATPATMYRIASISKLFTSTAIMQLRDAGKLQLDDPVVKYLPWFKIKNAHPDGATITIRHLLSHISGLPREAEGVLWNEVKLPNREEMIQHLANQETVFPTETVWKYSNLGMSLAGEIVASVSGESWSQYIENHILKPLGMTSTRTIPDPGLKGLAVSYGRRLPNSRRDVMPFIDMKAEAPAGNITSNIEELAKFASLQLRDGLAGGSQILRGSTLREMHRVEWLQSDWRSGWGLGFSVSRIGEQVRVGHSGSFPGHQTRIEIAPSNKLAVIVMTNSSDGDPLRYVDQAFQILNPAIASATGIPKVNKVPDSTLDKYVGTYAGTFADMQIQMLNGELTMISPNSNGIWDTRLTLKSVGQHTFRLVPSTISTATGFGLMGELLTFELDSSGRVVKAIAPYSYWLRK